MKSEKIYFSFREGEIGVTSSRHSHDSIEIYLLTDGVCSYFIDGESYTVNSGDVIVIPDGAIHRTNYGTKERSRYLINISASLIDGAVLRALFGSGYIFHCTGQEKILDLFRKIAEEYERSDEISEPVIAALTTELLAYLSRLGGDIHKQTPTLVNSAVSVIRENYSAEISLSNTAEALGVSAEHLSRKFKSETGFGFNEYLTLLRLRHAEYMLENESGRSVGEIAFAVGFNDSNYFSKRFKELYGVSPRALKSKK